MSVTIKDDYQLQELYRVTFVLRGILGMLGYSSFIAAYGLDDCLRMAKQGEFLINDTIKSKFLLLVTLLHQTVESAIAQVRLESPEWNTLKSSSDDAVASLKLSLAELLQENQT